MNNPHNSIEERPRGILSALSRYVKNASGSRGGFMPTVRRGISIVLTEGVAGITRRVRYVHAAHAATPTLSEDLDVLFLVGTDGASKTLRADHFTAELNGMGYTASVAPFSRWSELTGLLECGRLPKVIVLCRCAIFPSAMNLLQKVRRTGVKLICDFDDILFEPELVADSYALIRSGVTTEMAENFRIGLHLADMGTAPTQVIAQKMKDAGLPTTVIVNTLPPGFKMKPIPPAETEQSKLLFYGSGSQTHEEDFSLCEEAILDCLDEFSDVRLMLVGSINPSAKLRNRLGGRLIIHSHLPYPEYLRCIATASINLAPLQSTAFNSGKSEIKFIDAASVEVVTVASRTPGYESVITHGENGMLVSTCDEWHDALHLLLSNPEKRLAMGKSAHNMVMDEYNCNQTMKKMIELYDLHLNAKI